MLLNILQCTIQPHNREPLAPNDNEAEGEKPALRYNFMVETGNLN